MIGILGSKEKHRENTINETDQETSMLTKKKKKKKKESKLKLNKKIKKKARRAILNKRKYRTSFSYSILFSFPRPPDSAI